MSEPLIKRNSEHVLARGRYEITYDGWTTWAFTLWGARHRARQLKRKRDRHGTVVT